MFYVLYTLYKFGFMYVCLYAARNHRNLIRKNSTWFHFGFQLKRKSYEAKICIHGKCSGTETTQTQFRRLFVRIKIDTKWKSWQKILWRRNDLLSMRSIDAYHVCSLFTSYHPNVVILVCWNNNIRSILLFDFQYIFSRFFINEKKNALKFYQTIFASFRVSAFFVGFVAFNTPIVRRGTKVNERRIRTHTHRHVVLVIATDANATVWKTIEKNEDGWKCADPLECHCRFNNLFTVGSDCQPLPAQHKSDIILSFSRLNFIFLLCVLAFAPPPRRLCSF